MNSDLAWNDAQVEKLRELWAERLSTAEIGRRMGITKNAIMGKAHRLNLPPRRSPIRRPADGAVPRVAQPRRTMGRTLPPLQASIDGDAQPAPIVVPRLIGKSIPCCWPTGTPGKGDFKFCDAPSHPGRPYCDSHCDIAYVNARDKREDAVDPWR